MLTISPELALAFERGTLLRWKEEIAAAIRARHPEAAARFPGPALDDWVKGAMETLRGQGGTTWPDLRFFALTLFAVAEAAPDTRAAGDLAAIMAAKESYAARMAMLRKAFPAV